MTIGDGLSDIAGAIVIIFILWLIFVHSED